MFDRESMRSELHKGPCRVVFKKADGTLRTMFCTLEESVTGKYERKTAPGSKPDNPAILTVWDTEKDGWRAFSVDSVVEFAPVA